MKSQLNCRYRSRRLASSSTWENQILGVGPGAVWGPPVGERSHPVPVDGLDAARRGSARTAHRRRSPRVSTPGPLICRVVIERGRAPAQSPLVAGTSAITWTFFATIESTPVRAVRRNGASTIGSGSSRYVRTPWQRTRFRTSGRRAPPAATSPFASRQPNPPRHRRVLRRGPGRPARASPATGRRS